MRFLPFIYTLVASATTTISPAWAHGDNAPARSGASDQHGAAIGAPGDPAKVTRTIDVDMDDAMRFSPAILRVEQGDTVRFRVKNVGRIRHEMVLGSVEALKEHAALMRKFPEMEHADPNQATVDPGKTGDLVWRFTKPGTFEFACLQPGHFEAGMRGNVIVTSRNQRKEKKP